MGWTWAEQQLIDQLGYKGWLDRQLAYESIDDSGLEGVLAGAFPSLAMSPAEILANYEDDPGQPLIELILAAIYRALYSPRQLFERMVDLLDATTSTSTSSATWRFCSSRPTTAR